MSALQVLQAQPVHKVMLAQLDPQVLQDQRVIQVQRVQQDLLVRQEVQEPLAQLVP